MFQGIVNKAVLNTSVAKECVAVVANASFQNDAATPDTPSTFSDFFNFFFATTFLL